jgi:hypothetical protein
MYLHIVLMSIFASQLPARIYNILNAKYLMSVSAVKLEGLAALRPERQRSLLGAELASLP